MDRLPGIIDPRTKPELEAAAERYLAQPSHVDRAHHRAAVPDVQEPAGVSRVDPVEQQNLVVALVDIDPGVCRQGEPGARVPTGAQTIRETGRSIRHSLEVIVEEPA